MTAEEKLYVGLFFLAVLLGTLGLLEALAVRSHLNAQSRKLKPLYREEVNAREGKLQRYAARFNRTEYGRELEDKLTGANLGIGPFYWMVIQFGVWTLLCFMCAAFLGLKFPFNMLTAYFLTGFGSKQFLKSRRTKLGGLVNQQLPEVCRLMASCIRAGLSIQQSIEMVAKELKPPTGTLFRTMASELNMGTSLEDVMDRLNEQVASRDLKLISQTILIQRKVGGSLGEALDHLARTLEERERVNKELSNQTAESRFTALTLTIMPLFIIIVFNFIFKGFLTPLFTLPGMILSAIVVSTMALGMYLIRKVSNVKA